VRCSTGVWAGVRLAARFFARREEKQIPVATATAQDDMPFRAERGPISGLGRSTSESRSERDIGLQKSENLLLVRPGAVQFEKPM
jgi:hypothetical protein